MYVVGLTGGIGCGKSEAARCFAKLGVPVVDVDVIAHQLTTAGQETLRDIVDVFGETYLLPDGNLNRDAMREKVFNDIAARKDLAPGKEMEQNANAPYQVLAISLLFENQRYKDNVTRSLVIDCDESLQVTRTMKRSGLSEQTVRGIMAAQVSRPTRIKMADDLIENEGTLEELHAKIVEMHQKYMQACIVSK